MAGPGSRQALKEKQLVLTLTTMINVVPQNILIPYNKVPFSVSTLDP